MASDPREVSVVPVVAAVAVLALFLGLINVAINGTAGGEAGATATLTVPASAGGATIPSGFLGLSLEYPAVIGYSGSDPSAVDPVFVQLIRNLTPGQRPVLRIGGDSADATWWPLPGVARPLGIRYALTENWLEVTKALSRALDARLILGLNLEAASTELVATEAHELLDGIEPGSLLAFELGNEPELYGEFPWYRTASGRKVTGRPATYHFSEFLADFTRFAAAIPSAPLAGPTSGGPGWVPDLGTFVKTEPAVKLVTVHRYPLQLCVTGRGSHRYPTIAHLLSTDASTGLADSFAAEVATARAHGLPLRIDELNSVSCGADPAVSQTFASALWALDTLFELARIGVSGVNIHTFPGAGYELFRIRHAGGRWQATVSPEYYGLMMFALAAPPGSRLVTLGGPSGGPFERWATRAPDGTLRVVLIDKDPSRAWQAQLHVPARHGTATLQLLRAPSLTARSGTSLGGQDVDSTGTLHGTPSSTGVHSHDGTYTVTLPAGSAGLLTFPGRG